MRDGPELAEQPVDSSAPGCRADTQIACPGSLHRFVKHLDPFKGPNFSHFRSIGSDDPPSSPPQGVDNVKIRENSDKFRGPSTTRFRAQESLKNQKY